MAAVIELQSEGTTVVDGSLKRVDTFEWSHPRRGKSESGSNESTNVSAGGHAKAGRGGNALDGRRSSSLSPPRGDVLPPGGGGASRQPKPKAGAQVPQLQTNERTPPQQRRRRSVSPSAMKHRRAHSNASDGDRRLQTQKQGMKRSASDSISPSSRPVRTGGTKRTKGFPPVAPRSSGDSGDGWKSRSKSRGKREPKRASLPAVFPEDADESKSVSTHRTEGSAGSRRRDSWGTAMSSPTAKSPVAVSPVPPQSNSCTVIIPDGCGERPEAYAWYYWAAYNLHKRGYDVQLSEMPSFDIRDDLWVPTIVDSVNERSVLVGHGAGAAVALRVAECKSVMGLVLVAPSHTDTGRIELRRTGLFNRPWRWEKVLYNVSFVVIVSCLDDPVTPVDECRYIHDALRRKSVLIETEGDRHFEGPTFPRLLKLLSLRLPSPPVVEVNVRWPAPSDATLVPPSASAPPPSQIADTIYQNTLKEMLSASLVKTEKEREEDKRKIQEFKERKREEAKLREEQALKRKAEEAKAEREADLKRTLEHKKIAEEVRKRRQELSEKEAEAKKEEAEARRAKARAAREALELRQAEEFAKAKEEAAAKFLKRKEEEDARAKEEEMRAKRAKEKRDALARTTLLRRDVSDYDVSALFAKSAPAATRHEKPKRQSQQEQKRQTVEQSEPKKEQPEPKKEQPEPKKEQPEPKREQPEPKKEQSEPKQPEPKKEPPEPKREQPEPRREQPEPKKKQPEPKKEPPEPKKEQPEPKEEQPEPKKEPPEPKKEPPEPKKEQAEPKKEQAEPKKEPPTHGQDVPGTAVEGRKGTSTSDNMKELKGAPVGGASGMKDDGNDDGNGKASLMEDATNKGIGMDVETVQEEGMAMKTKGSVPAKEKVNVQEEKATKTESIAPAKEKEKVQNNGGKDHGQNAKALGSAGAGRSSGPSESTASYKKGAEEGSGKKNGPQTTGDGGGGNAHPEERPANPSPKSRPKDGGRAPSDASTSQSKTTMSSERLPSGSWMGPSERKTEAPVRPAKMKEAQAKIKDLEGNLEKKLDELSKMETRETLDTTVNRTTRELSSTLDSLLELLKECGGDAADISEALEFVKDDLNAYATMRSVKGARDPDVMEHLQAVISDAKSVCKQLVAESNKALGR